MFHILFIEICTFPSNDLDTIITTPTYKICNALKRGRNNTLTKLDTSLETLQR